jgi:hypothetical protein
MPRMNAPQRRLPGTGKGIKKAALSLIQQSRTVGPEQKAEYHQVTGAGTSRVKRQFLGLTPSEEKTLQVRLEQEMRANLRKQGA